MVAGRFGVTLPVEWGAADDALEEVFQGSRARVERFFELVRNVAF
ncbi:hypothetical protein [Streptomyces globisporus]|nr:hypothetical protein [Streptomyces globisporus]